MEATYRVRQAMINRNFILNVSLVVGCSMKTVPPFEFLGIYRKIYKKVVG